MAKRFIDTNIFKDPFIKNLDADYKILFVYIFCECNAAGLWPVELEVACIRCKIKVKPDEVKKAFEEKIIELDNGHTWFIPSFIKIQYHNELKETNKALSKVIPELMSYGLIEENPAGKGIFSLKSFNKKTKKESPFQAPSKGHKEEEEEKDKEEEGEKEEEEGKPLEKLFFPFDSENFMTFWEMWKRYKVDHFKFKYKSIVSEQGALQKLASLSDGNEETAIAIIKESISNGWQGFFKLKNQDLKNGTQKIQRSLEGYDAAINKRYGLGNNN